jgi:hypothetical protein
MRKLLFLSFFIISISSFAQFRLGLFGGIANYQGDLTDKLYQRPKPMGGIALGYEISDHFLVRAGFTVAKVGGADSLSDKATLQARNLSFQTSIFEFSLLAEYTLFDL